MKAKFTWNGQVIEQELRAMSDVPNDARSVYVTDGQTAQLCWYDGDINQWLLGRYVTTDIIMIRVIGWCEMPELMEVVG